MRAPFGRDLWLRDHRWKLLLTSILPFIDKSLQMPIGMCVAVSYVLIILIRRPYYRCALSLSFIACASHTAVGWLIRSCVVWGVVCWYGRDVHAAQQQGRRSAAHVRAG